MSQIRIDATNRRAVSLLADAIMTTPMSDRPAVLAAVYHLGTIRPRGFLFRLGLYLAWKQHGRGGVAMVLNEIQKRDFAAVESLIFQTATHVLYGNDTEDQQSVGGWSQREIDLFQAAVSFTSLAVVKS